MNFQVIIVFLITVAAGIGVTTAFFKLPNKKKIDNIKEWLKYAVVEAEKELGSGTGQLKLRMVYDLAVKQFPFIVQFVAFDVFSSWVDEALKWMNEQLAQNKATKEYVESDK